METTNSGTVTHWLHGERHYNVLVKENTDCSKCIHNQVCSFKMEKQCSNYSMGTSEYSGCGGCINRYTKCDTKQPIPCFHCKWFEERKEDQKYTQKDMLSFAEHLMTKLLSKHNESLYPTISSTDLTRIQNVLNDFRENK